MRRADSLLTPLIRELGIEDGIRLAEIKKDWYSLFNKPIAYHMYPCALSKGELLLNVDSPAWLQELNFCREDIIKKIRSYGVKTVRFRIGRVSPNVKSEVKNQRAKVKQLTSNELSYIEEAVARINDEALKSAVKMAMEKAIAAGKTRIGLR